MFERFGDDARRVVSLAQEEGAPARPRLHRLTRGALCGRDEERCERMLVAGGMRVCSECAHDAVAQLDALPADAPALVRSRRPDYAPSDKDAAIAAIEGGEEALTLLEELDEDSAYAPVVVCGERRRLLEGSPLVG